jgi:hypothetical protein
MSQLKRHIWESRLEAAYSKKGYAGIKEEIL